LQQGFSRAQNIQKLFGFRVAAVGPETHTYTSCHQYDIKIFIHIEGAFGELVTEERFENTQGK
jgi:hypothetical protein